MISEVNDITRILTKIKGVSIMDIAALSMNISQMKVAQEASVSVLEMAIDSMKGQSVDLTQILEVNTKMMEQSVNPHIGENIDISNQSIS